MLETCSESDFYLQTLLLLNPTGSAIGLLVLGAVIWLLWTRLKGWRKLILVALAGGLVWSISAESVHLSMKRAAALELTQTPDKWNPSSPFELRSATQKVLAFRVDLGSKCNAGFLVKLQSPSQMETQGLVGTVPHSPVEYRREEIQRLFFNPSNACYNRAYVMWGSEWRKVRPDACSPPEPKLLFFDSRRNDPNGFEMKWCTLLNDQFAYCEADSYAVALSTGIRF